MRKLLFIILVVFAILALSKKTHADSISAEASVGDRSVVNYGLALQKDWSNVYLNLENSIAGNGSSNSTTAAMGLEGMGLNVGIYGGDNFVTGHATPIFGAEVGNSISLGKSGFFLKDSVRVGRQTGSDLTYGSLSGGIGLTL